MTSILTPRRIAVSVLLGSLYAASASAQDVATMTVSANVSPSCQLTSVDALAFGELDETADNDAQADISWVCTNGFDTEIQLDGGVTAGDISARTMGGDGTLPYQLYTDASRTTVFGDGTTGDVVDVTGAGYGSPATVTVYGRVDQADAEVAAAGNYTDTINVTILF